MTEETEPDFETRSFEKRKWTMDKVLQNYDMQSTVQLIIRFPGGMEVEGSLQSTQNLRNYIKSVQSSSHKKYESY